ncbi:hypothetical protein HMPREF1986_00254 [Oribacterium sp. oral taxon 078 str. F0263]|nr:hypothetical protein HMPREF1986_00254 [Oribacterium sp. oral taxon 078 str. F0263]
MPIERKERIAIESKRGMRSGAVPKGAALFVSPAPLWRAESGGL